MNTETIHPEYMGTTGLVDYVRNAPSYTERVHRMQKARSVIQSRHGSLAAKALIAFQRNFHNNSGR